MQIFPIVSSSDGNCTYIKTEAASILIDCGITLKALHKALGRETVAALDAVFVTHEHHDHISGLGSLGRRYNHPIYINHNSFAARAGQLWDINKQPLEAENEICIRDLVVTPFELKHDTSNNFGFMIKEEEGSMLCYLTDTGVISDRNKSLMSMADALLIECNYNEHMLRQFPDYSDELKSRIMEFHLSNRQTLDALEEIGVDSFEAIILAHLSPRTNSPQQLTEEFTERFPAWVHKFGIAPCPEPVSTGG